MALTEISHSRDRSGDAAGSEYVYKYRRVFTCPEAEAETHEAALWAEVCTKLPLAGPMPALHIQVVGKDPKQPGNTLITAVFGRSLTYDPSTFPLGRATMSARTKLSARPLTDDGTERGLYIEQPPDRDGMITRVIGGPRMTPQVDGLISVRTSYQQPVPWRELISLRRGKVNADAMPKMMEVEEQEALLIHADVPQGYRFGDPREPVPIEFLFWHKIGGWHTLTTLQRKIALPLLRPVLHAKTLYTGELWYEDEASGIAVHATADELTRPQASQILFRQTGGQWDFQDPYLYEEIQTANFSDIHELL